MGPEMTQEQREAERLADRITYGEGVRTFKWTDEDFARAKAYGFPAALGRYMSGEYNGQTFFSRRQIAAWREPLIAFATRLG